MKNIFCFYLILFFTQIVMGNVMFPDITFSSTCERKNNFESFSKKVLLEKIEDIFEQPRASLLFLIDQVLPASVEDCTDDTLIKITNFVTGKKSNNHGIFGKFWKDLKGKKVTAFGKTGGRYYDSVQTLSDLFKKKFGKKSVCLAVSVDEQCSKAAGVNVEEKENSFSVYFKGNKFSNVNFGGKKNVEEFVLKNVIKGIKCENTNGIKCSFGKFVFDLKKEEIFLFFTEIYSFYRAIEFGSVKQSKMTPDLYTFVFTTLKGIVAKYGLDSTVYSNGSKLLMKIVVPDLIKRASAVYDNRIVSNVITLGLSDKYKKRVVNVIKKIFKKDQNIEDFYPNVYLPKSTSEENKNLLCNSLKSIDDKMEVICGTQNHFTIGRTVLSFENRIFERNSTRHLETRLEVMDYQIFIWVSVLIIFGMILALTTISNIDYSQDFLLYAFDEETKKVK